MAADPKPDVVKLPLALREILAEIHDESFRDSLERVFDAAAGAIKNLRNFELIRYEGKSAEAAADLQLFEEVAPVLMATVNEINTLVQAVESGFPAGHKVPGGVAGEAERAARSIEILRERTGGFRADVLRLGAQLRTPQAVADRWNLLGNLQSARGRLRFGIGEMVTDVANVFAEVPRAEVVPEYELDVEHALLLRRTLAKLTAGIRGHHGRLKGAKGPEIPALVEKLTDLLDRLTKTQTWFELRAPDKREFIRFREQIASLGARGCPPDETRKAVEGFTRFLELLCSIVSQRDLLRSHDRACLAEITATLERAEAQLPASVAAAREVVGEALELCDQLTGRDDELDRYLTHLRAAPELPPADCIVALREHALRLLSQG
ncbi:MAG TPA: hypothetical protein VMB50_15875 [Myxococcales bacterium]|nr:hypothetical protein [Myxococcales bacterium]